ncbi:hypothetical protein QQP08_009664 [Theobroma cacao]|nr:hypothetical protein QQP08_009664 [Theobroma cacao]
MKVCLKATFCWTKPEKDERRALELALHPVDQIKTSKLYSAPSQPLLLIAIKRFPLPRGKKSKAEVSPKWIADYMFMSSNLQISLKKKKTKKKKNEGKRNKSFFVDFVNAHLLQFDLDDPKWSLQPYQGSVIHSRNDKYTYFFLLNSKHDQPILVLLSIISQLSLAYASLVTILASRVL